MLALAYYLIADYAINLIWKSAAKTALMAASDFLTGDNKPFAYYVGLATGTGVALATSLPSSLKFYAAAEAVKLTILKSEQGGEVRIFVDGVQAGLIDTTAEELIWEEVVVTLTGGRYQRSEIVLEVVGIASAAFWFALGGIEAEDGQLEGVDFMAYDVINFRLRDSETDAQAQSLPIYIPAGKTRAEINTYIAAIAPEIDALTGARIESVDVTLSFELPGGLKATPESGILNERGGLLTFDTSGPRADSVRIPAIKTALMPADSINTGATAVTNFVTRLTTETTAADIRPVTAQDYNFTTLRRGKKSFRK